MTHIEWIPPGTIITCGACEGSGVIRWFWPWTCGYCNGRGQVVHMPNSTTTAYPAPPGETTATDETAR